MLDQPHHDGSELFVPQQQPALGELMPVFLRVPHGAEPRPRTIHLRSVRDGEPGFVPAQIDREDETETWWRAELDVHNPVTSYRWLLGGHGYYAWLNGTGVHRRDVTDAFDFRAVTHSPPPSWARDAVIYQVFPDRFARSGSPGELPPWATAAAWNDPVVHQGRLTSRQLYGGDLPGLQSRLDYLVELGIDTVYLTPFFPARSNHRYDASSFDRVDPLLGGDEALAALAGAMHRRGMHLIGDLTTNHTGDAHPWFQAAQRDPESAEASFYFFTEHPHAYAGWFDVPSLPKLDWSSAALSYRLVSGSASIAGRWLQPPYDLDGWRIDVANMTARHGAQDLNAEVARALRTTMAQVRPDAFLIGEHGFDASAELGGDGWHAVMNYAAFLKPVWTWLADPTNGLPSFLGLPQPVPVLPGPAVAATMRDFAAAVPWRSAAHAVNLLGSHDTARIRTVVGSDERVAVAAGLMFTLPGVPQFFMGDELGLEGVNGEHARTPMPWDREGAWAHPLLATYRSLIALRRSCPALRHGGLRWVHLGTDVLVFLRETAAERLLVLAARAPHAGLRLALGGLTVTSTRNLYGGAEARVREGSLALPGDGPTVQVWQI